jgi:hypothetical protein
MNSQSDQKPKQKVGLKQQKIELKTTRKKIKIHVQNRHQMQGVFYVFSIQISYNAELPNHK